MSSDAIFEQLKGIIVDQLGVDESLVVREASFVEDLNADSLDLVDMIMTMEEKFKFTIPDADVDKIRTVGDALDYIEDHLH